LFNSFPLLKKYNLNEKDWEGKNDNFKYNLFYSVAYLNGEKIKMDIDL